MACWARTSLTGIDLEGTPSTRRAGEGRTGTSWTMWWRQGWSLSACAHRTCITTTTTRKECGINDVEPMQDLRKWSEFYKIINTVRQIFLDFSAGRLFEVGAFSKLGAYQSFAICSHTFPVSLFSINNTKNKGHCPNFIPSICVIFWGAYSRMGAY